ADQELLFMPADDYWRLAAACIYQAPRCGHEHRLDAPQLEELLWHVCARERPQSRADAAAEDHGYDRRIQPLDCLGANSSVGTDRQFHGSPPVEMGLGCKHDAVA